MRNQKWLSFLLSGLLLLSLFTGCGTPPSSSVVSSLPEPEPAAELVEVNPIDPSVLLTIQQRYAAEQTVDYTEPLLDVARDHRFELEIGFDPFELGMDTYPEICGVYQDPGLTVSASTQWEFTEKDDGRIVVSAWPFKYPSMRVSSTRSDADADNTIDVRGYYLYDRGEGNDWGNLAQYYFAVFVDVETGEKLEKPLVTIFTVQHELAAPQVEFFMTDDGRGGFRWDAVQNAERYYIVTADQRDGSFGPAYIVAETSDTEWIGSKRSDYPMNSVFRYSETEDVEPWFCVMAANESDISAVSNLFSKASLAASLPYAMDYEANSILAEGEKLTTRPEAIWLLPSYTPIIMCDGSTILRFVYYNIDEALFYKETWFSGDITAGEDVGILDGTVLGLPFWPEGTTFVQEAKLMDLLGGYDADTVEDDLAALAARQEELRPRTGNLRFGLRGGDKEIKTPPEGRQKDWAGTPLPESTLDVAGEVFGTTALSQWIGANMLAGQVYIDLSEFPEAFNDQVLEEALWEAVWQNPLVLGMEGAYIIGNGLSMRLEIMYRDDPSVMLAKQAEVKARAEAIVSEIIRPGMTDLEKEYAINNYLCATSEYDWDAYEHAEQNEFSGVDPEYGDAFSAYGILIKGVGVCASYAAAFQILADLAGLESVVVTGSVGTVGHAWNRVKIDGNWDTIDVTNNNVEYYSNNILNMPDSVSSMIMTEDDDWIANAVRSQYRSDNVANEYYRVQSMFYSQDEIVDQLVSLLEQDGEATLRTDYFLTDNEFVAIAGRVQDRLSNERVNGGYWLGIIYLYLM